MTRQYKRPEYQGGGEVSFSVYPGDNRSFSVSDGRTVKTIAVRDVAGYVFKLNKTYLSAIGGAQGVFDYVDRCLSDHFCECYAWSIINHVFAHGK